MSLIDLELEISKKFEKYYKNVFEYAKKIRKKAEEIFKDKLISVYLFGSLIKGNWIPLKSDIDILIVVNLDSKITRKAFWKAEISTKILKELDLPEIFQLHILSLEDFKKFEKMIDKKVEIK